MGNLLAVKNVPLVGVKATRQTMGNAVAWTPEEIQQMASMTALDVMRARTLWHKYAPKTLRTLLDGAPLVSVVK